MLDFITNLDFMGREFKFNIGGGMGEVYKTLFGGLLSILQVIGFIVLLWYYGQDIYLRESPSVIVSSTLLDKFPMVELDSTTFNFGYRMEDVDGNLIDDPSEFTYDAMFRSFVSGSNGFELKEEWTKDMERCSIKHFDNYTLYNDKLFNYYCLENNYTIGGDWGSDSINIPTYFIRRCNSKTEKKFNITCMTDEELKKKYNGLFYVDLYLQKNLVNPHKYENPIKPTFTYSFKQLDIFSEQILKQAIFYSTAELITDTGILFSDVNSTIFLEYESKDSTSGTVNPSMGSYVSTAEFYVTRGEKSYTRVYIRLSDALANVGGLMSLFAVVIETVFSFYLQTSYSLFLQEKFLKLNYEVKDDSNKKIEIELVKGINNNNYNNNYNNVSKEQISNIPNRPGQDNFDNFNNDSSKEIINNAKSIPLTKVNRPLKNMHKQDVILNKEIVNVIEYKKHKLIDVNLTACEYFCFTNCSCKFDGDPNKNLKYKLFKKSEKEIEKRIQILDYIKLVDQFKLLQKIILNKNQCYMLKKRELHRIIDGKILSTDEEEKLAEEKEKANQQNLCNYLSTRKSENSLSQIDILLFTYMENELKLSINGEINLDEVI